MRMRVTAPDLVPVDWCTMTGPYGQFSPRYLQAGFSPLPLPAGKKKTPPAGFTGRNARGQLAPMADAAQVTRWITARGDGNIALRLPGGVIGVDADCWKGQAERVAWEELTSRCGPLPADAPRCTSRSDGESGIRLFRVPPAFSCGGNLPAGSNGVSPGEVIQVHHRYVVAPPSRHPEGTIYRWVNLPDGEVPEVASLPELPAAWLDALRSGQGAAGQLDLVHDERVTANGQITGWTSPDITALLRDGVPPGQKQDDVLRDLAFQLRRENTPMTVAGSVWLAVTSKTTLTRPGQPWTDADFQRHWQGADAKLSSDDQGEREEIEVGSAPATIRALREAIDGGKVPETYVTGGRVVHVEEVSGTAGASSGNEDLPLPVTASEVGPPALAGLLAAHTFTYRTRTRKGDDGSDETYSEEVTPPNPVLAAALALKTWPRLRPLHGIVGAPVLRPDGSLLQVPGYDQATGLYLASKVPLDTVPAQPTKEQIAAARRQLLDTFLGDFPG